MRTFRQYLARRTRFAGVRALGEFHIKVYHIAYAASDIDGQRFSPAVGMAESTLPHPATNDVRPGVGFLILHQGRGADYAVLGWWDRENELPIRLFVREQREEAQWRVGRGSESFCVWDLEVMWHERQAYVATYLTPSIEDPRAQYLRAVLDRAAE